MFGKKDRRELALIDDSRRRHLVTDWVIPTVWRFRRQLAPFGVAGLTLAAGGAALGVRLAADDGWLWGCYGVGGLCAAAWLSRLSGYDRGLGAVVTGTAAAWTLAVAYWPTSGALYGLWALGTPVLGLGWWMSGTLRAQLRADRVRHRWDTVAKLAGVAGAHLLGTRATPAGEVLRVKLTAGQNAKSMQREAIESAYELRPGAVKVEQDEANARVVFVHITETDPWTADLTHPALKILHTDN
ncbi:hypothetical protein QEZ54_25400 [Catellatospora sp. KI3]|uniref:hypothetical protein n=1 Tax=Catellatospora sp. KI3 TaxID=3041620 RepID=UPI002482E82B|nr:hypothetical protein [Catellatospora sp. KI3]MDI1464312.1 hypothetical protein [Catellatospora sp. KI3]